MISESLWSLGGTNSSSKTAKDFYVIERGTSVYEGNASKWIGKVGLMYPSDYGYATSGGLISDRSVFTSASFCASAYARLNACTEVKYV